MITDFDLTLEVSQLYNKQFEQGEKKSSSLLFFTRKGRRRILQAAKAKAKAACAATAAAAAVAVAVTVTGQSGHWLIFSPNDQR